MKLKKNVKSIDGTDYGTGTWGGMWECRPSH